MDALAFERVQIGGQRRDERLAFARLHLGDLAFVEDRAADELDVEVPHVQHAAAGLAHHGERLGQQVVERLAVGEALAELDGLAAQLLVGQRLDVRLEGVDLRHDRAQALQFTFVLGADDFGEQGIEHLQDGMTRTGISSDCSRRAARDVSLKLQRRIRRADPPVAEGDRANQQRGGLRQQLQRVDQFAVARIS